MIAAPPGLLSVPGLAPLLVSSWLWHLTRWGGLFCCSYLVTKLTHQAFLSQLVGALIFAPMLVGGFAAGAISDRFDRHRVVLLTQLALLPLMVVMFTIVQAGRVRVWMVFPFMFALGVGGLVNMTSQRAIVVAFAGPSLGIRALTMESVGLASASMAGPLLGGAVIGAFGLGAAFGALAVALCMSVAIFQRLPRRGVSTTRPTTPRASTSLAVHARELVRRSPSLVSMLGVTVVLNAFYFAFIPLVPVMAERFHADATATGVLGAMAGCGSLLAGLVIGSRAILRPGRLYVMGAVAALACLGLFALAPVAALGFLALFAAGAGSAGFSSMQSALAMDSAGEQERGAALGLVSMAIGSLPLGMLLLGVSASLLGARLALLVSSTVGLVLMTAWLRSHPQVWRHSARA